MPDTTWIPGRLKIVLLFAIGIGGPCRGAVVTYPAPPGIKAAPDFQVSVNGRDAFVYDSAVAPYVQFSFSGRAKVTVKVRPDVTFGEDVRYMAWGETIRPEPFRPPIRDLAIRPKNLGLRGLVKGNQITFEIDRPANLSLEINGNLSRPLLIFASPLEKAPPKPDDPGVRYFAPGKVYEAGRMTLRNNETIYIAGGAVVRGRMRRFLGGESWMAATAKQCPGRSSSCSARRTYR